MFQKNKETKPLLSFVSGEVKNKLLKNFYFSIIGGKTYFNGKMVLKGETRLAGRVDGVIISEDVLILEESAEVKGEIHGKVVEINGFFDGNLNATHLLTLSPTAVVGGNICTARIVVEAGAKIRGKISSLEPVQVEHNSEATYNTLDLETQTPLC